MIEAASVAPDVMVRRARALLRRRSEAALATLDAKTGAPMASHTIVACALDGSPILLLSRLASHGRNVRADPRLSLLVAGAPNPAAPIDVERLMLEGEVLDDIDPDTKARYLARYPSAAQYADFGDFQFFQVRVERIRYVEGFANAFSFSESRFLVNDLPRAFTEALPRVMAHMNEDHGDAIDLLVAVQNPEAGEGPWRMTGCDPDGFDACAPDQRLARVSFPEVIRDVGVLRETLVRMTKEARAARSA